MDFFRPLHRSENRAYSAEFTDSEEAITLGISRETTGEGSIYGDLDTFTTTIELGTGAAVTDIFIGGDTTFNGNLCANQLKFVDNLILLRSNEASGGSAALINERGGTGLDFLLLWSETNSRFEIGLADTINGSSVPSSLSTFSDTKINNLIISGTSITADAALTMTATGGTSDFIFGARGVTTPLNDVSNTTVSGFTNTSIIGILNELKSGSGIEASFLETSYTNGEASPITEGQIVYISANDTVRLTDASSLTLAINYIGAVGTNSIPASSSGNIKYEGSINIKFEISLVLSPGDEVFLSSSTLGSATNIKPSGSGNVVYSIGTIKDASIYDGNTNLLAEVHLVRGSQTTLA